MGRIVVVAALACIVTTPVFAAADPWGPLWHRRTTWSVGAVAVGADGRVTVTGTTDAAAGGAPAMVLATYEPDGSLAWRTTWRSRDPLFLSAAGQDVAIGTEGRIYVVGAAFNDTGEHARSQLWAYSQAGQLRWHRPAWGPVSAIASAVAVSRGVVVVGGTTFGECARPRDGRLASFTAAGTLRWRDPFEPPGIVGTSDLLSDLAIGPGEELLAVGSVDRAPIGCDDAVAGRWSDEDVVVQALSLSGSTRWTRVLADPSVRDVDEALTIGALGATVVVAGRVGGDPDGGRAWLARFEADGHLRWSRSSGADGTAVTGAAVARWGPVYTVGTAGDAVSVRRWSTGGHLLRGRRLPAREEPSVAAAALRTVIVGAGHDLWRLSP